MKSKILKISTFFMVSLFAMGAVYAVKSPETVVTTINCGKDIIGIPIATAKIIRTGYLLIKIAAPIALVFMGMLDFGRAVIGSKEDEIKKNQSKFVKRLIAAVVLFLVLSIVEFVFALLASSGFADVTVCINAIINGKF